MSELIGWSGIAIAVLGICLNGSLRKIGNKLIWSGAALFLVSIIYSMTVEDLLETLPTLQEHRKVPYTLGVLGFLTGLIMLLFGAAVFLRANFTAMGETIDKAKRRPGYLRGIEREHRMPAAHLFARWRPGLLWMGGAFVVFFLAASARHENHFPLAWLWALFGA